ncbi:hypothetical protein BG015_012130 [Linnemannia schmuckeri]|uniref:Uncharacterized protein n=1 Tax=Linnemannia schmuckeri TaxID=64567 RepID=A0A9P5RRQ0_9FUNG|nr:hypothetical protein BG015_012130 [Linnemannia schmuckeri]
MTINSKDNALKMQRRIISLTLVAFLVLSLSLSTTTAKPISHNNNHNYFNHALKSNNHPQHQARNGGGLLKRLSSSWTSLTASFQGLHVICGSPGPAANSNSGGNVKRLHKRDDVDSGINKKPVTVKSPEGKNAQKKKADKATARAKHTYAAYEAIVNSDSQMPVFLNQLHPKTTTKGSGNGKGKDKPTTAATPVTAGAGGGGKKKKVGTVKPIDFLRQTGVKRPVTAAAATICSPSKTLPTIEDEEKEKERKKAEMEGTSPAKKPKAEPEGMTPAQGSLHPNKKNDNNTNKVSSASRAVVAATVEDGTSTVKTSFDTVFSQDLQQPSHRPVEPALGATGVDTAVEKKEKDSEDIKAIKETINAAAHAAVAAAAAAAVAGNSHHNTSPNNHHLEQRDTAGILKQALENIAHKIEEAATAAIALEIPSLTDHTLGSHSATASHEKEAPLQEDKKPEPVLENHKDAIIDDEGAVDLPTVTNNNNHNDNAASTNDQESGSIVATQQKPGSTVINDNEYTSSSEDEDDPYAYAYPTLQNPVPSTEYSDNNDEWRLSDDDDYMAQYVHRRPDNFPGSESVLFTGTVLQRTLASSFLLLSGFLVLLGFISYKMYTRRRNTSPWAFLHYMTFGIFTSLFYDSTSMSNSTLNSYITTTGNQTSPSTASSSTMKKGYGFGAGGNAAWLRKGSLTRSSITTKGNNNIMTFPAEKEPLLPEPVVASSASSSFKKSGPNGTELRRTSTAQHHQMQIELALQQQQRWEKEQQQQQAEMDYLQKSFIRRTSI